MFTILRVGVTPPTPPPDPTVPSLPPPSFMKSPFFFDAIFSSLFLFDLFFSARSSYPSLEAVEQGQRHDMFVSSCYACICITAHLCANKCHRWSSLQGGKDPQDALSL